MERIWQLIAEPFKTFESLNMNQIIKFGILLLVTACASTSEPVVDKPLVGAEARDYSFDHIEGLESNLAGEGLELPQMVGGLNALQKEVNKRLEKTDCPVRGKVTVVYIVDEKGVVIDSATAAGIHEVCDAIAEEAVKEMVFSPAKKNGNPVRIRMGSPVTFN